MTLLMETIRYSHITAGFIGLAAFWIPIFARKGGKNHRFFGKIFKYCAYLVLAAAGTSVVIKLVGALRDGITPFDTPTSFSFLIFLGYLTLVTFIILRHGMMVLRHKPGLMQMDSVLNRSMAWLNIASSIGLIIYAIIVSPPNAVLLYALSPIGLTTGWGILACLRGKRLEGKAWFYEHMGALIGVGIAFHTAFAVFGASQIFSYQLSGFIQVIPWILPALIGVPGTVIWTRYYKHKFGDLPMTASTAS